MRGYRFLPTPLLLFGLAFLGFARLPVTGQGGAAVIVNGVTVSVLKTSAVDGTTPARRALAFSQALARVSEVGALEIKKVGTTAVILNGNERLITITAAESKAHNTVPYELARNWVKNIRAAAKRSELEISSADLRLPVGVTRSLDVSGYRSRQAVATTDRRDVAQLVPSAKGWAIRTTGPGSAVLALTVGNVSKSIAVEVQPYALVAPQALSAEVTGPLAVSSIVQGAVEGAIKTRLKTAPGAQVKWTVVDAPAIGAGESRTVNVRYSATANDAFPREGTLGVVVRNLGLPAARESALWYCNDPESLKGVGPLFAADLGVGKAVRLLYHHVNETSSPLIVRVQLVNDTDTAATVAITPGDSEPDRNPVLAGYRAGQAFFRPAINGSAEVVTVPARSSFPIAIRRLDPKETISGLCRLALSKGPPSVFIRADAIPPISLEGAWEAASASPTPWRETGVRLINDQYDRAPYVNSVHLYPVPYRQLATAFEVGGRYKYVRIGEQPLDRADEAGRLEGNFGVWYAVKAELSNPTSVPADVEIIFEASAGYSGGLFTLDGVYLQTGLLQPGGESRLRKYRLAPGEKRSVDIRTIPLSGSSYPATLTIRPVSSMDVVPSAVVGEGKR